MKLESLLYEISNLISDEIRSIKKESFDEKELSSISLNHLYYLEAVNQLEYPTISSIAQKLNVTSPSATVMIRKLIAQGYLYKVKSKEDKRVYYIYLEEKGKKLVHAEEDAYKNIKNKMASFLSKEELKQFKDLTEKIIKSMRSVKKVSLK